MKNRLRLNEKTIYRIVSAGVLAGMALFGGEGFPGTGAPDAARLMTALAVLAVFGIWNFTAVRGRILCVAVLSVLLFTAVAAAGPENSAAFLRSFFPWLTGRGTAPEEWHFGYGLVQTGLLTGICCLVQVLFEKLPAVKAVSAGLVFGMLAFCLFARREPDHYGVAFGLCFCVLVWVEEVQNRWEKVRGPRSSREARTLWILPFLALYLLLLAVMPAPEKPYDWLWAKTLYSQLKENFLTVTRNIRWGSREGFGMAFSGFSESGELGGDLQEESGVIMTIETDRGVSGSLGGNLYLTGRVYDTFDGRGWQQTYEGYPGEVFLDTAETLYAVRNYNGRYQRDYLREISLKVRYEDFHTGYVFAPFKTWSLEEKAGKEQDYRCVGGSLRWTEQKGYGTEYGLRCFEMNRGQQEFDRFLEAALKDGREHPEGNAEVWTEVLRGCRGRNGEAFTRDDMTLYREEIYEHYLGEGMALPAEVSGYLQEITGNAVTELEKLRAIERTLQTFSYTLTPGELPEWVEEEGDFLAYFLLESRYGYCTYFASAFVLLARAEGIPARYVQGYCIPMAGGGERTVNSSMAHAWPEVYLDGIGWIPFEPTPGYGEKRYASWEPAQPAQGEAPEGDGTGISDPGQEGGTAAEQVGGTEEETDIVEPEEAEGSGSFGGRLLGIGIPLLLAVCALLLALDRSIGRYRYSHMELREKFRVEVLRNLEILSRLGGKRREWETLQELGERMEALPEVLPALHFLADYECALYGNKAVDRSMLEGAVQDREALLQLLKREKKWVYFYCRALFFFGGMDGTCGRFRGHS